MIGMFTSVSTMSGSSRCASSSPCLPSPAVPMTSMSSSNPSNFRRLSRVLAMSSTMRSRIKSIATSAHRQSCCLHRVHGDARPHGRGNRDRLHVGALCTGGLGSNDRIHQGGEIVAQFVVIERRFADCRVNDPGPVIAKLDASTLDVLDRLRDIEVDLAALYLLHQVLAADHVRPGFDGLAELLAGGEHRDPPGLPGAMRQGDRAADNLVRMARVDAKADVRLNRRIKCGDCSLADE